MNTLYACIKAGEPGGTRFACRDMLDAASFNLWWIHGSHTRDLHQRWTQFVELNDRLQPQWNRAQQEATISLTSKLQADNALGAFRSVYGDDLGGLPEGQSVIVVRDPEYAWFDAEQELTAPRDTKHRRAESPDALAPNFGEWLSRALYNTVQQGNAVEDCRSIRDRLAAAGVSSHVETYHYLRRINHVSIRQGEPGGLYLGGDRFDPARVATMLRSPATDYVWCHDYQNDRDHRPGRDTVEPEYLRRSTEVNMGFLGEAARRYGKTPIAANWMWPSSGGGWWMDKPYWQAIGEGLQTAGIEHYAICGSIWNVSRTAPQEESEKIVAERFNSEVVEGLRASGWLAAGVGLATAGGD